MEWMHPILFIHSPVDEHVGSFHFFAITNGAVVNIRSNFFCVDECFNFSWVSMQEWNSASTEALCLTGGETVQLFSRVAVPFYKSACNV